MIGFRLSVRSRYFLWFLLILFLLSTPGPTYAASPKNKYQADSMSVFWGDIHGHTAYSQDAAFPPGDYIHGIKDGPEEALDYALSSSGGNLDFLAFTDHAEAFQTIIGWKQKGMVDRYEAMIELCKEYQSSRDIIVFPGFEYTNSELPENAIGYGHKCVIFKGPDTVNDRPIPSPTNTNDNPNAASVVELWQELDASPAAGNYITIPHHPAKGMRYENNAYYWMGTDWSGAYMDSAHMPLVEIYSVHGSSERAGCEEPVQDFQDNASVEAGLRRWFSSSYNPNYKLGIVASTDNHMAKPGSVAELQENVHEREGPFTGGLVAVWASGKTRDAIWGALKSRHSYATSGARIKLEFSASVNGQSETIMGDTLYCPKTTGMPPITLDIRATGENGIGIEKIEVYKNTAAGTEVLEFFREQFSSYDEAAGTASIIYTDSDASNEYRYYRVKVYQSPTPVVDSYDPNDEWDEGPHCANERAWSSPIWVEPAAADSSYESNPGEIRVVVNGEDLVMDVEPVIIDGRTLVPMRAIFEELGATVDWNNASQTATGVKDTTIVSLTIGSTTAYVNNLPVALEVPAQIVEERTMVPVRFVSESLGADVDWDETAQTVYITME